MDRIIDCTEAASAGIETMLDQLDFTKKAFEEKGGKAGNLRFLLTFAYLMAIQLYLLLAVEILLMMRQLI